MTDLQTLFRTIDELTPEEKQQVVAYIQERREAVVQPTRIPGLFPGIWISEDFNAELPESFWMGEE